jgi:hypothetical protein
MCAQASPRSGIKEQEGGGNQGWFPSRSRRSWDGVGPMDEKAVRKLEKRIGKTIPQVISDMRLERFPLLPSHRTVHLMARGEVAVYEAAVENDERGQPSEGPVGA